MPLDIKSLNEKVRSGDIEGARQLLAASDDPRAAAMLAKLNTKYPPSPKSIAKHSLSTSRPVSSDDLAEVKSLIAQREYDKAEVLLWNSKHPDAADLLRKIQLVKSAPQAVATPQKGKSKSAANHRVRNLLMFTAVAVLIGCGIWYYTLKQQSDAQGRELSIFFQVQDICDEVFQEKYLFSDLMTVDEFIAGCKSASRHMIDDYTATVGRCHDTWPDEDYKMMECLVDGGAKMDEIWMIAGSKE